MADAPCDISGKCEVSDEDERSGVQEAMCVHCGGWRYRNHHRAGNWGVLDGSGDRPRATPPAAVIEAMERALRPFAFFNEDNPDEDVQTAWETRYRDRFRDWIDFGDIEAVRAALADLTAWRAGK